jgi:hypothetical protein
VVVLAAEVVPVVTGDGETVLVAGVVAGGAGSVVVVLPVSQTATPP